MEMPLARLSAQRLPMATHYGLQREQHSSVFEAPPKTTEA